MKPSKKIFSIIIAVLLCFAVVLGSGGCKKKKLIRLEVYSQLANYSGKQVGMMAAALEDKFGVEMVIIKDDEGIYETRMESGFLGDIVVWGSNGSEYKNAIKNGLLFDWEEEDLLKNYGPYILEHMSQALEANREINENGKIYGIGHNIAPSADDHENFFYTWDIRWDLYNELGRPEINDLNDYYNLLVEMKNICPKDDVGKDTYAVSLWPDWDGNMVMYVKAFATAYYGYDEHGIGLYDPNTGRFYGALEQGGPYLESLKFFNRLYRAGLLDPNSMTQTYDNMSEKVTNGGTFFSIFNYSGSYAFNSDDNIANNRMMLALVPNEANVIAYGMNPFGGNRIWSIGADTRYPELCMKIINWLCTPEGSMYNFNGLQGLIWDYDKDGNTYFTEFGRKRTNDPTTLLNGKIWKSPWSGKTYELSSNFNDGK
ncbi:MAG: extracellular solute-binding protein [Clostridiales bacterium]|nr:extracellular solute-binding protein [Clostridiales bacterium]